MPETAFLKLRLQLSLQDDRTLLSQYCVVLNSNSFLIIILMNKKINNQIIYWNK